MSRLARVELGLEARAHREDHLDTRMWLRLLACSTDIEQAIRQRLRQQFGTTRRALTTSPSWNATPRACA